MVGVYMKVGIKIFVFSFIAVALAVIGLFFAKNTKSKAVRHFSSSGYIINNVSDSEDGTISVNKEYFEANTSYSIKSNQYTFENTDGKKITLSEKSFIHYSNGDIMSLSDGVAIDLDQVNSKLLRYYNIFF